MSIDCDFLFACTHVQGKYKRSTCPVCLSTGFYFDMVIDTSGNPVEMSGVNKTVQGVTHLLLTEEKTYADYNKPEYGSRTLRYIGNKNMDENRLKYQVLRDIQYYMQIKEIQQFIYANISVDEVIRQIVGVKTRNTADEQSVELALLIGDESKLQFFKFSKFQV